MPKVSVGRIVHFRVPTEDVSNGGEVVPALVTQVFPQAEGDRQMANLLVFRPFAEPKHYGSVYEASDADQTELTENRWFWPPRVD